MCVAIFRRAAEDGDSGRPWTDLGAVTAAPYTVQWANVPVGNFAISAVVTNRQGVSVMSAAVELTRTSQGLPPPCAVPDGDQVVAIVAQQQNSILNSNTTAAVTAVASIETGYSISSVTFYAADTFGADRRRAERCSATVPAPTP